MILFKDCDIENKNFTVAILGCVLASGAQLCER